MDINGLPVFQALIDGIEDGIYAISLVDVPAVDSNWITLSKETKKDIKFSVENEEQHILMGVVMRSDYPIYRNDYGYEYFITYNKETIRKMSEKMMADNTFNNIDVMHNGDLLPKGYINLQEIFIKNVEGGVNPKGFEEIEDGSLFAKFKVNNEQLWEDCKNGNFNGFSLAGWFSVKEEQLRKEEKNKKQNKLITMSKLKEMLKSLLLQFGEVKAEDGTVLYYEGDTLEVGTEVKDENDAPIADGEYIADGKKYKVFEGKVTEVEDVVAEEKEEVKEEVKEDVKVEEKRQCMEDEPTEPAEPKDEPTDTTKADVEALRQEIESLKAVIEEIKAKIAEISQTPKTEPIVEQFRRFEAPKENKAATLASYLNK